MKVDESGLVQSVRTRLLATAMAVASDPNTVIARYGIERFLYRLSISPYADRFVLKGAMLLSAWLGQGARSTRDIDLLGIGMFTLDAIGDMVAEKVHAMAVLGLTNTRLKDVHDVAALSRQVDFDGATLASAIEATFVRRKTAIPEGLPAALTPSFAADPARQAQWRVFLTRSRLENDSATLESAAGEAARFLRPVLVAVRARRSFALAWKSPGPWRKGGGKP